MKKTLLGIFILFLGLQVSSAWGKTLCSIYSPTGSMREIYILADAPFSYSLTEAQEKKALSIYGLSKILPCATLQLQKLGLAYEAGKNKFILYLNAQEIKIKRLKPYLIKLKITP